MLITEFFDIQYPIVQAPMAGVQDSALAIAVSNAGGLGSLPCAMLNTENLRIQLDLLSSQTRGPFNVNFFCHTPPIPDPTKEHAWRNLLKPYYDEFGICMDGIKQDPIRRPFTAEAADILEGYRPSVVSFHFGLPEPQLLNRVRSWGTKIISSATTLDEARWLASQGVDAIIAQGVEAGGHRGIFKSEDLTTQVGTISLTRQILKEINLPVIACGGIGDRAGVKAALTLGAAGVQIGTAYLLCSEATTKQVHREALKSEQRHHTALTNLFTGRPARGIMNRLMSELGPISNITPEFPLASAALAPLRSKSENMGSGDFSSLWAGQYTGGCKEISASEITHELAGTV